MKERLFFSPLLPLDDGGPIVVVTLGDIGLGQIRSFKRRRMGFFPYGTNKALTSAVLKSIAVMVEKLALEQKQHPAPSLLHGRKQKRAKR